MIDSVQVASVIIHAHDLTFGFIFYYRSIVSDAMSLGCLYGFLMNAGKWTSLYFADQRGDAGEGSV